jgi:hypothetical protein
MKNSLLYIFLFLALSIFAPAQTTEYTYQGKLNDGSLAANGSYDFQFELYDAALGGNILGTQSIASVPVNNGIFTVRLNFGDQFNGTDRFLAISVRNAGGPTYTLLNPRQPITSAPYSIRSLTSGTALNATHADLAADSDRLGGVTADQFVVTTDARMTDARTPLPGSPNYVRTGGIPQIADFNITGEGIANTFDAITDFRIGGSTVLSSQGSLNIFVGEGAGVNNSGLNNSFFGANAGNGNTSGNLNSFFGANSGLSNTSGINNAFFGNSAGRSNIDAGYNSFFGSGAGFSNTVGSNNSFFGSNSGIFTTTGPANSFFGKDSGFSNTTGGNNSFFGYFSGRANTVGINNSFFGLSAGESNTSGDSNTFVGAFSGDSNLTGYENAFFGQDAGGQNTNGYANSFFGYRAGWFNTTGIANAFFGSGAGQANTTGIVNAFFGRFAGSGNTDGFRNSFLGPFAGSSNTTGDNNTMVGAGADVGVNNLTYATAIGADAVVSSSNTIVLGRSTVQDQVLVYGPLKVIGFQTGGNQDVCRISGDTSLASCSSSLRYKSEIENYPGGLDVVRRLRPITFTWNTSGVRDIGFAAEEVASVEPLLATYNDKGEIEGVKYKQITTVLVNAVIEQQRTIERQNAKIDALMKLVCAQNPTADICKP